MGLVCRGRNSGCPAVRGLPEIQSAAVRRTPAKFGNIFTIFYSQCRSSTTATTPIDQVENDRREPTGLLTSYYKFILSK